MAENENGSDSPRSFNHFFARLDGGEAHGTASEELHELNKRLRDEAIARCSGVKGQLIIKIDLKADERGAVEAHYSIDRKEPKRKTSKSHFWLTKQGHLSVENPSQQSLPLREVSAQGQALREMKNDRVKEI